jgi:G:T-mismatch repair DNA endonuclease (very short patch repair protein)
MWAYIKQKQLVQSEFIANKNNLNIKSAKNDGEFQIGKYYVDGLHAETNTVYEFHGCYFHGCPRCFRPESFNEIQQTLMSNVYNRHKNRIDFIKTKCSKLVEIWECEFYVVLGELWKFKRLLSWDIES